MIEDESFEQLREIELVQVVAELLPRIVGPGDVQVEPELGNKMRPDILIEHYDGRVTIVEVKGVTPGTGERLRRAAGQLALYAAQYRIAKKERSGARPGLVLVVPGALSEENRELISEEGRIRVIDGPELRAAQRQDDSQGYQERPSRGPGAFESRLRGNCAGPPRSLYLSGGHSRCARVFALPPAW